MACPCVWRFFMLGWLPVMSDSTLCSKSGFSSGVLLVFLFASTASYMAGFELMLDWRMSPLIIGIVLGMIYANTLRSQLPAVWMPGVAFCAKQVLRAGIVLYGFQISFADVQALGWSAFVLDAAIVCSTLLLGVLLGRLMRMDAQMALLTSVGSSICGAAAVLGAEPVVKGAPYKAAVAVSTVVIFGTLSMFLYPALYRAGILDLTAQQLGLYTGATLHEVAHVYGAGEAMNMAGAHRALVEAGLVDIQRDAVIVKMMRVMMLAPVLLFLGFFLRGRKDESGLVDCDGVTTPSKSAFPLPMFVIYFLGVIALNSFGIVPEFMVTFFRYLSTFMLTMAMTALGINTTISQFRQAGFKPFVLALILFFWLLGGGYVLTLIISSLFD